MATFPGFGGRGKQKVSLRSLFMPERVPPDIIHARADTWIEPMTFRNGKPDEMAFSHEIFFFRSEPDSNPQR